MVGKNNLKKRLEQNPDAKLLNISDLVKEREYDGKIYKMHDARPIMNEDKTIVNLLFKYDNEVNLKLLLLNKILKEYEHYYNDINVDREIKTNKTRWFIRKKTQIMSFFLINKILKNM